MASSACRDTKEITLGNRNVAYTIVRSSRRTFAISIDPLGNITIRGPKRASEAEIRKLIASKERWIVKHLERIEARPAPPTYSYTDGELHPLLGKMVPLRIVQSDINRVASTPDHINIEYAGSYSREHGRMAMEALYKMVAGRLFPQRIEILREKTDRYNLRPARLKIRSMKSRWGSCSTSGSVTLNSLLAAKRVELIDYVILHELCHLRHHNHGSQFHALLKELSPNYKELRKELRS